MNIILVGFMGTGKTVVGRLVAEKLHAKFVDVDAAIEDRTGQSLPEIFSRLGEAAFREIEASMVREVAHSDRSVIATGGGALLDNENREALEKNGVLVCLTAGINTLLERLRGDLLRPLLAGEPLEERLERLMQERAAVYAQCPIQIPTDGQTVRAVADEVIRQITPRWRA